PVGREARSSSWSTLWLRAGHPGAHPRHDVFGEVDSCPVPRGTGHESRQSLYGESGSPSAGRRETSGQWVVLVVEAGQAPYVVVFGEPGFAAFVVFGGPGAAASAAHHAAACAAACATGFRAEAARAAHAASGARASGAADHGAAGPESGTASPRADTTAASET